MIFEKWGKSANLVSKVYISNIYNKNKEGKTRERENAVILPMERKNFTKFINHHIKTSNSLLGGGGGRAKPGNLMC